MKVLVRGIRLSLLIARSSVYAKVTNLKKHSDDMADQLWPADANPDVITDAQLEEFIRLQAKTVFHPVGTARIGAHESDSVVNPQLLVHGVKGLRIVDASIFPSQVSGHPVRD